MSPHAQPDDHGLQNAFNLLEVDAYYQNIIKGIIISAALTQFNTGP